MKRFIHLLVALALCTAPHFASADLSTNLVSYWKFDESSGNPADSVGSNSLGNNGTATFGAAKINNGVILNGTSQYLAQGDNASLSITGSLTLAGWINFSAYNGANMYAAINKIDFADGGGNRAYGLLFNSSGSADITFLTGDGSNQHLDRVTWSPSTATAYHIAVVFDAAAQTKKFYVNGSQQGATQTSTGSAIFDSARPFQFGMAFDSVTPSFWTPATFDEWGLWSRALDAGEVTQLYNAGTGCSYSFGACPAASAAPFIKLFHAWWW